MKSFFLHKKWVIGIVLISSFLYAQEPNADSTEKNNLEFQTNFFEALKQTAIHNYGLAIISLEKCTKIDSVPMAVDFEFSKNYLSLKKYNEATIFLENALEKEPNNRFLLAHKVLILKAQQQFKAAIEIQKELVNINPKYKVDLALLFVQNQQMDEAEKLLNAIVETDFNSMKINGLKDFINQQKAKKQVSNKSDNVFVNSDLESLKKEFYSKKEYKVLLEILKQELNLQQFQMVVEDCKYGLELFPVQPFIYKSYALALNKLGKYNDAITVLTIGIDFVLDDPETEADFYEQYAISYTGLGKNDEALKNKQKELKLRK